MYSCANNTAKIDDKLPTTVIPVAKGHYCAQRQMRSGRTQEGFYCPFNVRTALDIIHYNIKNTQ